MASMIQNFLGFSLSFGKKPTLMHTVTHYGHNHAFVLRQHKSLVSNNISMRLMSNPAVNFPQLPSQTAAKRHPHVVVSAANDGDQELESKELPETKLMFFILNFFHAINVNNREDIEDKLSPMCEVDDPVFKVTSGKKVVTDFILNLTDALGPNLRFIFDGVTVEKKLANCWDAHVKWHLEWRPAMNQLSGQFQSSNSDPSKEAGGGAPFDKQITGPPIPKGVYGSNVFECELSDNNKFLIRKIVGEIQPEKVPKFRKKLVDIVVELLIKFSVYNDDMKLLKTTRFFYQEFPQEASELLDEKLDDE